jgi:hypothetical protein
MSATILLCGCVCAHAKELLNHLEAFLAKATDVLPSFMLYYARK